MHTQNLNFLTGLADIAPDGSIIVPDSMHLAARVGMEGAVHCRPETEGEGRRLEFGRRL